MLIFHFKTNIMLMVFNTEDAWCNLVSNKICIFMHGNMVKMSVT